MKEEDEEDDGTKLLAKRLISTDDARGWHRLPQLKNDDIVVLVRPDSFTKLPSYVIDEKAEATEKSLQKNDNHHAGSSKEDEKEETSSELPELPVEVWAYVFKLLGYTKNLRLVCKRFHEIYWGSFVFDNNDLAFLTSSKDCLALDPFLWIDKRAYDLLHVVSLFVHLGRSPISIFVGFRSSQMVFLLAARLNHLEIVQWLLAEDSRIDPNGNQNYAMWWACDQGFTDIVKLLLTDERVENPACKWDNENIIPPCYRACQQGHTEVVKLLWTNLKTSPDMRLAVSSLQAACERGRSDIVEWMLQNIPFSRATLSNLSISGAISYPQLLVVLLSNPDVKITSEQLAQAIYQASEQNLNETIHILLSDRRTNYTVYSEICQYIMGWSKDQDEEDWNGVDKRAVSLELVKACSLHFLNPFRIYRSIKYRQQIYEHPDNIIVIRDHSGCNPIAYRPVSIRERQNKIVVISIGVLAFIAVYFILAMF